MKVLRLIDRVLAALVTGLLVAAFALMLGLAVAQILLRQIFHTGLLWGDLAARHLVIWVGFFGATLASRRAQHFRVAFLVRALSPTAQRWLGASVDLFAAVVCLLLVAAAWTFITVGMDPKALLMPGVRQTTAALIVPAGFFLMAIQFLLRCILGAAGAAPVQPARGPD